MTRCRQLFNWQSKALTLFDVLAKGPKVTGCRLSATLDEIDMTEVCGLLLVPAKTAKEFQEFKSE